MGRYAIKSPMKSKAATVVIVVNIWRGNMCRRRYFPGRRDPLVREITNLCSSVKRPMRPIPNGVSTQSRNVPYSSQVGMSPIRGATQ